MKLVESKQILAGVLALLLAACQSTPDTTDSAGSEPVDEPAVEETSSTTDTFGTGERGDIDAAEAQEAADALLLSTSVFYFDFDRSKIKAEAFDSLKAHARYLMDNSSAQVRLEGHADERGTREYNVALGERRGNSIAKFLRLSGVSGAQMEVISYGEEKPVAAGHDEASWALNRRVELVYTNNGPN